MAGTGRRTSEAKTWAARHSLHPRAIAWTITAACLLVAGPASAEEYSCPDEPSCTSQWPNILYLLDYSAAMNSEFDGGLSRWEATIAALTEQVGTKYFNHSFHAAFLRFGHDPSLAPGSLIPGDNSEPPLVDGQALDHPWYDAMDENPSLFECAGDAIINTLQGVPPPVDGLKDGIDRWTKGALDRGIELIAQSKAEFPQDEDARVYANVVITGGAWTDPKGDQVLAPAGANPEFTAGLLWEDQEIRTYVIYTGDPRDTLAKDAADGLALAGGTTTAHHVENTAELSSALEEVAELIRDDSTMKPTCISSLMRLMVLLDASSAMLNVDGGGMAGGKGTIGWDHARAVINSLLVTSVNWDMSADDLLLVGLTVFGDDEPAPGEDKLVVDYGECRRDNLAWALDPKTSCKADCDDPWGGPPITWTFADGALVDPPKFAHPTISHMPRCTGEQPYCAGSGGFIHLGLQRIRTEQVAFHAASQESGAAYPAKDSTVYLNLLVTNGLYEGYSTDAQVQAEIEAMYNDGITTIVLALGDGADSPGALAKLQMMALWGSGGQIQHFDAESLDELRDELKNRIEELEFDPCCIIQNCSLSPEPGVLHECHPDNGNEGCQEESASCLLDPEDQLYHCVHACGDGVIDPEEECDDGNLSTADECQPDCVKSICGDGVLWLDHEECDDGNSYSGDGCSFYCTIEHTGTCGNGVTDWGEDCDDGNSIDDDECTNICTLSPVCGDSHIDPGEECDDGNSVDNDGCTNDCTIKTAECGDGVIDPGEMCDDGNSVDDDGCTNRCTLRGAACGDGAVDPGEACDDGNSVDDDACTNTCSLPRCGDAILHASELCDDGNTVDDDDCRNDCSLPGIVSEGGCQCTVATHQAERDRQLLALALSAGLLAWSRRRRRTA